MSQRDALIYGVERARSIAFDAVYKLWLRREAEGMTQADLARATGRDEAWVSRTLSGPGNWTIKTIGTLVQGLNGELEITAHAMEDPVPDAGPDAYERYLGKLESPTKITVDAAADTADADTTDTPPRRSRRAPAR
jgi:transcriptional regulator with XRE-family HTH domain